MSMPLGRYFAFVGSVLLTLLFLVDWCLPQPAAMPDRVGVDKTVIRLQSSQKWPERIVIDTSLPTIIPPPAKLVESHPARSPPAARPPREALALMTSVESVAPVIARRPAPKRRTRTVRAIGQAPAVEATEFRTASPMSW